MAERVRTGLLPAVRGVRRRGRPPRSERPGRREAILRARVLRAAAHCFAQRGYFSSSVEHIIGRARMSRRTFYRLFESKEDVLEALHEEVTRRLLAQLDAAMSGVAGALERVRRGIQAYIEALASHRGLARVLLVDVRAAGPRLAAAREQAHAAFAERIEAAYAALVAEGVAEPPHPFAARALVGAVNEVVSHLLAEERDPRQATSFVIEIVERHLRSREPAGERSR
jgi:AcrR family transcriptional regulator